MESYVERIKHNGEHLAKEVFPKKALELDQIISVIDPLFFLSLKKNNKNFLKRAIFVDYNLKGASMDTENMSKVCELNDFPRAEDFLAAAGLLKNGQIEKENIVGDDVSLFK